MNCQFEDALGGFSYKNQCNTIITTGKTRVTRRVIPQASHCGWISTAAKPIQEMGSISAFLT
jgi:hypothetical protein